MSQTEPPAIRDELERKTREHLTLVLYRLDRSEIEPQRALGALDALWAMSSGLVSRDLMDDITEAHTLLASVLGADRKAA